MPSFKFNKPYYNVTSAGNEVATEEAWNVYFEALPSGGFAIRKRPGLDSITTVAEQYGQGVHWSDQQQRLHTVVGGMVYSQGDPIVSPINLGTVTNAVKPAVFADGQALDLTLITYIATGGKLNYIDYNTGTIETPTDALTPTATFVAALNNRFYANSVAGTNTQQDFLITDVDIADPAAGVDPLFWSSSTNPWRAEQRPDYLSGIYTGWNEVYLWGSQACEVWQEDGVNPISPLLGSIIEAGCIAPYSVVRTNNTLIGLCQIAGKRCVAKIAGRAPEILSEPIANKLYDLAEVSDAIGSLCFTGGLNHYIITFPTERVTWAYDFKTDVWCQWSSWDSATGSHKEFEGYFADYAKGWNKHVVLTKAGVLNEISRNVYSDNGTQIKSSVRTGWLDHGTWDRKRSNQLIIKLNGYKSEDARILMRWRSDGFPEWSTAMELPIQYGQQNDHFCKLNRMGMYRSRQYEFIMTDAADLGLIGMEEDVTRMRN